MDWQQPLVSVIIPAYNAKREYIAPIDADDIWYPQKLEKQAQCMEQADATAGLVYASIRISP